MFWSLSEKNSKGESTHGSRLFFMFNAPADVILTEHSDEGSGRPLADVILTERSDEGSGWPSVEIQLKAHVILHSPTGSLRMTPRL
jgi:hypothetical protein